jgi:hypothetical protein
MSPLWSGPWWMLTYAERITLEFLVIDHKPVRYLVNADTDKMLEPITWSSTVSVFPFFLSQVTVLISLINLICWSQVPSPRRCGHQNILNLHLFGFSISCPDCAGGWNRKAPFSRKMNHPTVAYCAYKAEHRWARQVPSFLTLTFQSFTPPFTTCCTTPTSHSMASEADQILRTADEPIVGESNNDSRTESDSPAVSTSSNTTAAKIADKTVPDMSDYWKKIDNHRGRSSSLSLRQLTGRWPGIFNLSGRHSHGRWLHRGLFWISFGCWAWPSSQQISCYYNELRCELVHFNPNAIIVLSCLTMLCEYWLGIAPDTSLFWYFYSLTRYDTVVYSGIGLSLRHHRRKEYIDATFKSSWRGSFQRWFLVDMHVDPQWVKRHLLPPLIDNKRGEPEMTLCLTALVKQVTDLCDASLRACRCAEEFILQWICPLVRRDALVYECPRQADLSREPTDSKNFNFVNCWWWSDILIW